MKNTAIILLLTIFLIVCCNHEKIQKETVKTVKVFEVSRYGDEKTESFPGKVKAASEVNLSFRISGLIYEITVKEGEYVHKGQILAELDSRDYALQFSATEAEYNRIKSEAERIIQLYEKQSVAENDYDKAVSGLKQITAKFNSHKNSLEDTKLKAPIDGYIQKRFFGAGETIGAGLPVFSIISADMPEVIINIPASVYIQSSNFEKFTCNFDLFPEKIFPLELISINHKANMNQLHTVRLKLLKKEGYSIPSPGISTMVTIYFKQEDRELVSIPLTALFEIDNNPSVWVYNEEEQVVIVRNVKVNEILSSGIAVISNGLQTGEKIVSAGVHTLANGERVKKLVIND